MRSRPFAQFNFSLTLGRTVVGGFQEASGITKLHGLNKSADVTLKRGVIGASALRDWLKSVRGRDVTVEMRDETGQVVGRWTLHGARIVKHTAGAMNAKGSDVAMEELVLAYQRLTIKPV